MKSNFVLLLTGLWVSLAAAQQASVTIAWSKNSESDLLGYRVHYGTSSRAYSSHMDVGAATQHEITGLTSGTSYYIALTALDVWGNESAYSSEVVAVTGAPVTLPWRFSLESAFPNPLRAGEATLLRYGLPDARDISLAVYNALGQRVRTIIAGPVEAGYHQQSWDGRDDAGRQLAAGVYYVKFQTGIKILVNPLTLIH